MFRITKSRIQMSSIAWHAAIAYGHGFNKSLYLRSVIMTHYNWYTYVDLPFSASCMQPRSQDLPSYHPLGR